MDKLIAKLRATAHEDSIIGHSLRILVLLLNSTCIQSLITIVCPIIISIITTKVKRSSIIVIMLLYSVTVVAITMINNYNRRKILQFPLFVRSTHQISAALYTIYTTMFSLTEALSEKKNLRNLSLSDIRRQCSIQTSGFAICRAVLSLFADESEKSPVYVTLYQKTSSNGKEFCQMIAYANSKHEEPVTYKTPYLLNEDERFMYYHNKIFIDGNTAIHVLPNKEQVQRFFRIHPKMAEREKKICQYVGIPIKGLAEDTSLLLQLDTDVPDFWGESETEILERIENLLHPLFQLLALAYEQDRLVTVLYNMKRGN